MFQSSEMADRSSFIFGGRLVASTDEFSVFESASGRVLKLTGISRSVCERSVGTRRSLGEAIEEVGLDPGAAKQLQDHLVGLRLFHEVGVRGFLKKYLRIRLDLPLIPASVVSWMCRGLEASWTVLTLVALVLLLASAAFLVSQGGIPMGMTKSFDYRVFLTAVILNTFLHEMGHAYALHHGGQRPGTIGLRIMGPFVAAYTDVNSAWALPPKQRALVSIAGLSVQAVTTVILSALLFLASDFATVRIFFWATLFTMIFMALPMRENDGDWFLKDMIEHSTHERTKRTLFVIRKCFALVGLAFFLHLILRGWQMTLIQVMAWDRVISWSLFPYLLGICFLCLGTWSMGLLCIKEYRELAGRIRSLWANQRSVVQ